MTSRGEAMTWWAKIKARDFAANSAKSASWSSLIDYLPTLPDDDERLELFASLGCFDYADSVGPFVPTPAPPLGAEGDEDFYDALGRDPLDGPSMLDRMYDAVKLRLK